MVWVEHVVVGTLEAAVDEAVEIVGRIGVEIVLGVEAGVVELQGH